MRGRLLNLKILLVTSAVVFTAPAPAEAFYWAGWPGAGDSQPPAISQPQVTQKTVPPREPFAPNEPPKGVPEPATIIIAGLGLGVIGLRKVLKRKK